MHEVFRSDPEATIRVHELFVNLGKRYNIPVGVGILRINAAIIGLRFAAGGTWYVLIGSREMDDR